MRGPIERQNPLRSGIRRIVAAAAPLSRELWLALRAALQRAVRPIADARREHALRRARYWGTYS